MTSKDEPASTFRLNYRPLTSEQKLLYSGIKTQGAELERLINKLPKRRYQQLAMDALELSVMWAIKELTT